MKVQTARSGGVLKIKLYGEMDEYSAPDVRAACDRLIDENAGVRKIIINLADVAFMDSTGIGFLIGRYKKARRRGVALMVENPNFAADKVLSLSGIYTLIPKV
ncbi:MAG TPA: STAS domain-containing protein [Candidatus Coproplasma excrementipullorum]|nr:STAS domain-containing protein [Candidatus Coproplasma excrementipullorum]